MQGRSDMSQALLFNTAALEDNLAAAQRGETVHLTVADEPDDSLVNTATASNAPNRQTTSRIPPGA